MAGERAETSKGLLRNRFRLGIAFISTSLSKFADLFSPGETKGSDPLNPPQGSVEKKWKLTESAREFPKSAMKESLLQVWDRLNLGIVPVLINSSKLADLLSPTTLVAADACISARLSLAVVKSRGPLPAGGTDCSTLRSTIGRNGANFWAKRG